MSLHLTAYGLIIAICLFFTGVSYGYDANEFSYVSPEGIQFTSYSEKWNEQKLKELYEVLLRCEHGEELSSLKKVILYPDKSVGKSGARVGSYNDETRTIKLYEVETASVIRAFVHEYGHHFTYYWLQKKEGIKPAQMNESAAWAKARQLEGFPVRWSGSNLPYIHKWDIAEIMAEDYMLLFGIDAHEIHEHSSTIVNLIRHENEYIPVASSLPALRKYWEELTGITRKESLRLPVLQQWSTSKDGEAVTSHLIFSSSANRSDQYIHYGIQILGFNDSDGVVLKKVASIGSTGTDPVELKLELYTIEEQPYDLKGFIQIWVFDSASKQLTYTPFYMNWFSIQGSSHTFKAIPPPFAGKGFAAVRYAEGIVKWPFVHPIMNGLPLAPIQRYEDKEGHLYIPLRLLSEREGEFRYEAGNNDYEARKIKGQYRKKTFRLQLDEQLATVNDAQIRLNQPIRRIGVEPMVAVDDLETLFGIFGRWDETGNSIHLEIEAL